MFLDSVPVPPAPFIADARAFCDAADLVAAFGAAAPQEAAVRADRARALGNHLRFCHWRQIERLIRVLSVQQAVGTIH